MSLDLRLAGWAVLLVAAAWLPPPRWQVPAMAVVGATFLAASDLRSFALLLLLGALVRAVPEKSDRVGVVIAVIVAAMVTFKSGVRLEEADRPVVLGLAFYGLRLIHVATDRAAGRLAVSWRDHFSYLFFLPTLIAGPIHRAQDFRDDAGRRRLDCGDVAEGMERILYGLVKIVFLGNWVNVVVDLLGPSRGSTSFAAAYLRCAHYGWNLYFQFAGYSDVAIGLGRLVGFRLPENFNWPFLATSLADFWTRWHATASAWCRDYVYLPLAHRLRSPYLALAGSLLVLGLWHELSPRYCLWGAYHGAGLMAWRWLHRRFEWPSTRGGWVGTAAGLFATWHFVVSGFAFTAQPDLVSGLRTFLQVASLGLIRV